MWAARVRECVRVCASMGRGQGPYQDLAGLCGDVGVIVPVSLGILVPYHQGPPVILLHKPSGLNLVGHHACGTKWRETDEASPCLLLRVGLSLPLPQPPAPTPVPPRPRPTPQLVPLGLWGVWLLVVAWLVVLWLLVVAWLVVAVWLVVAWLVVTWWVVSWLGTSMGCPQQSRRKKRLGSPGAAQPWPMAAGEQSPVATVPRPIRAEPAM